MFRRLLTSFILLLGLSTLSSAQIIDRAGITVSGTYSNLHSSDPGTMERNYMAGFGAGIFVESKVSAMLMLVTSAEFSSRRYVYITRSEPGQNATHNLFHLSIPVLAKLRGPGFLSHLYGKIGPRFDIFLGSKDEMILTCGDWECSYIQDKEVMANSKMLVPGWTAALGSTLSVLGKNFSIELRYNNDFGTINKDAGSEPVQKKSIDIWLSIPLH